MFLIRLRRFHPRTNKIFQLFYKSDTAHKLTTPVNPQEKISDAFEKEEKDGFVVPIFKKALLFGNNIGIKDHYKSYTFIQLFASSQKLASQLSNICGSGASRRICILCPNDVLTLLALWACWMSGQVAVPLSGLYPISMVKYAIKDSEPKLLITSPDNEAFLKPLANEMELTLVVIDHMFLSLPSTVTLSNIFMCRGDNVLLVGTLANDFYTIADAMIEYTTVTDCNPKKTILTHQDINEQIKYLTYSLQFKETDCILHIFPVNSIRGGVNALLSPLCSGAKVILLKDFTTFNVWNAILGINTPEKERPNIIMGMPVIYDILIDEYNRSLENNSKIRRFIRSYCRDNIRVMTTSFSPLKQGTFVKWKEITGHCLLEGANNEQK